MTGRSVMYYFHVGNHDEGLSIEETQNLNRPLVPARYRSKDAKISSPFRLMLCISRAVSAERTAVKTQVRNYEVIIDEVDAPNMNHSYKAPDVQASSHI